MATRQNSGPGLVQTIVITVLVLLAIAWFLRVVMKIVAFLVALIVVGLFALVLVGALRASRRS